MNKLIFANLFHRPLRSVISVCAVAIEVVMILSIVGIFMGMLNDQKTRTNGIGADLVLRPANSSFLNGVSGAPIPVKLADYLGGLPHVAIASPVFTQFSMSGGVETIYGIEYKSFNAMRPFVFLSGGPFQGPYDVIIDNVFARTDHGYHVGDWVTILRHKFRICGIVESGKGGRKMIPLATMEELTGDEGKASIIYIKSDNPANIGAIEREIEATPGMQNYRVMTLADLISLYTPSRLPGFDQALDVVIAIAVIVGFLVIFETMYTAVLERTREIGILKSLGASKPMIVSIVLRECSVLAVIGVLLGIGGTLGVRAILEEAFPTIGLELTVGWIFRGAAIALVGAVCGALYPSWIAARKDAIEALAYE